MRNAIEQLYFSLRTYLVINTLYRNNENMRNDFSFPDFIIASPKIKTPTIHQC